MANPNPNQENLKPARSKEEARKIGKAGGIASGESRRKKRELRDTLRALLEETTKDGRTGMENIAIALLAEAEKGNVRAFAEIRDTLYGKPVSTVEMTGKDGSPLQPPAVKVEFIKNDV